MEPDQIISIIQEALWLTIKLSAPIMGIGLVVGLIIALFQALTQIQEITLAFVPKIIAIFMAMFFLFPSFTASLNEFTLTLSDLMIGADVDSQVISP